MLRWVLGFKGRIGRLHFWALGLPYIAVFLGLLVVVGVQRLPRSQSPAAINWLRELFEPSLIAVAEGRVPTMPLVVLASAGILFTSASTRRLHDRGRSAAVRLLIFFSPIGFALASLLVPEFKGWAASDPRVFSAIAGAGGLINLWGLFLITDMLFLPGSAKDNKYGPYLRAS